MRRSSHHSRHSKGGGLSIPAKANKLLNLILVAILLILFRIWHLTFVQHEERLEHAKKPQRKVIIERAERATIRDRFNFPLAMNKVQYNAAISYAQIREIPSIAWERGPDGKRIKKFKRKEHIKKLSELLAKELNMQAERIEDLIHGKAALLYNMPFVLKEEITEKQYFRLKMLEKDWMGIHAERVSKRYYPKEKVAADIIGYLGRINRQEYDKIVLEIRELRDCLEQYDAGGEFVQPSGLSNPAEARLRLKELEERAYTINDYIGKSGIEAMYDEVLRGFRGKRTFFSDARGNYLRELPGAQEPLSGQRFLLTISAELQEYAERLLAENEAVRREEKPQNSSQKCSEPNMQPPWIKGGAIVVMDPNNGEILAMASYPRFSPNDFIPSGDPETNREKLSQIRRWLEIESHIAELWDQKQPLIRERFSIQQEAFFDEAKWLTWSNYLGFILPANHPVRTVLNQFDGIQDAISLQLLIDELIFLSESKQPGAILNALYNKEDGHFLLKNRLALSERKALSQAMEKNKERIITIKASLDNYYRLLPNNYDKLLLADICKILVKAESFPPNLLAIIGGQTLSFYKDASAAFAVIQEELRNRTKEIFHLNDFAQWRLSHQKEFLKQKREEEALAKVYQRPYIDHLDNKEKELFHLFWTEHKWDFIIYLLNGENELSTFADYPEIQLYRDQILQMRNTYADEKGIYKSYQVLKQATANLDPALQTTYLKTLRTFNDLERPLLGFYPHLANNKGIQLEKHLAAAFYPLYGFGFGRSQAYRQAAQQGSIFKLVTAYEALRQTYHAKFDPHRPPMQTLNPLTIIDEIKKKTDAKSPGNISWDVARTMDGKAIHQFYKGGRIPRSSKPSIGKVDILGAIEASSNPYFALLAGDVIEQPEDLIQAARLFSYGEKTGIQLPGEIAGTVPDDIAFDRTGLYSVAIGQHSLVNTPLQTAVMLSAIANGGKVYKPKIVALKAGKEPVRGEAQIFQEERFAFQDTLSLIDIDFPLFSGAEKLQKKNLIDCTPPEITREIFMPDPIREILLNGMRQVIVGPRGLGPPSRIPGMAGKPALIKDFLDLQNQIVGKTSTSEVIERVNLDLNEGTQMVKHVWFGCISFNDELTSAPPKSLSASFQHPELVVVVYLRYGDYGKEAAPLAIQIIKKWREIVRKHHQKRSSIVS